MAASTLVTLGYSVSGGLQAGTNKIATVGFGSDVVIVTAGFIRIRVRGAGMSMSRARAEIHQS